VPDDADTPQFRVCCELFPSIDYNLTIIVCRHQPEQCNMLLTSLHSSGRSSS
jgi:hypothetical protein